MNEDALLRGDGGGEVDGPTAGGAESEEAGGGVDGKGAVVFGRIAVGAAGDGEHGGVMDGVTEDGVGGGDAGAGEGGDFAFVGGDVEDGVGGEAVGVDGDAGGEDAVGGDVEAADAFFDDPVVGGADGPDIAAKGLEFGDELAHFGEDVGLGEFAEELGGGAAEIGEGDAAIDLDHFAADGELGDFAAVVGVVAAIEPGDLVGGEEAGLHGPAHEGRTGVAGPEGAVAIEYGDFGGEGVHAGEEVLGGEAECGIGEGDRSESAWGGQRYLRAAEAAVGWHLLL